MKSFASPSSRDGIGKEVMPEGLRALEAAGRKFGIK
jgi:isocitrate/isopropylmalate dehydrogenase